MIILTIGNSQSQITNCSLKVEKDLKELLSYTDNPNQQHYSGNYGKKYLINKRGEFPSGLLPLVQTYLESINAPVSVLDTRVVPKSIRGTFKLNTKGIYPYPEQSEAAEAAQMYHRGTIVAPTGFGKSLVIASIIDRLQVKTLIVVPTVELKHQLRESLTNWFGSLKNITVENVDSSKLPKLKDFDCVIVDEAHHSGASTYRKLNKTAWGGIYYRFFLTATPFRSQDNEQLLLESVISQVIYRVSYQDAVRKGYIVPMEAYFLEIPSSKKSNINDWKAYYSQGVVHNEERNKGITDLLMELYHRKLPTLCLVKEIAHGKNLSLEGSLPFMSGQDQDSRLFLDLFNKEKIKVLIGTTGVLGEGVDTKPCEYVIVAGLGKSRNLLMQIFGRSFRVHGNKKTCKIILIRHNNHKWALSHYKEQCKVLLEEYGVTPQKLEI